MEVRLSNVSHADKKSSEVFFKALLAMYSFTDAIALDAFARNGQLTVPNYFFAVKELHLWELGEEHAQALEVFSPKSLQIGCSYKHLNNLNTETKFDLVVIDTPQGIHSDYEGVSRVEHFDFLSMCAKHFKDDCVVVLYVNKHPYNKDEVGEHGYDQYKEYDYAKWMGARDAYYHSTDGVIDEAMALAAYKRALKLEGFDVASSLLVPCYSDVAGKEPYAFRLALRLRKIV